MAANYQVTGKNDQAPFTLKLHRGEGMCLLGMNWREGRPPDDFAGFAIEFMEPGGDRYFAVKNRLNFAGGDGTVDPNQMSSRRAPFQKFRWVHFPRNAEKDGEFTYRVTPVFMNGQGELSHGEAQTAAIRLSSETWPAQLNVTFTRGFVSSQAFVDHYVARGAIDTLLPPKADEGLRFVPTHPDTNAALEWMGFEARKAILDLLDRALTDNAQVRVVAYDLSEREVVNRLVALGDRLKIIIDDSGDHGDPVSGESQAAALLVASAGPDAVLRQHMGRLQHNKLIVVDGPTIKQVVCGSTNFSWRGLYVQANNAIILTGETPVRLGNEAFESYRTTGGQVKKFGAGASASWADVGLVGIDAKISFSPHNASNALLEAIAEDLRQHTTSSLLFSLAFLYQTEGPIRDAVTLVRDDPTKFVYGISDKRVGGLDVQKPDGNVATVNPAALSRGAPEPFKSEPTGGGGTRMHHKFLVVDFDQPSARVYMGSYNFSRPADRSNGENLLVIRDRRVATAYAVEAIRLFDHYHFRLAQAEAKKRREKLTLQRPTEPGQLPWFEEDYTMAHKIRDREIFA